jgi:hypothetical protein
MATRDLTVPYLRLRSALHRKVPGRFDENGNTTLLATGNSNINDTSSSSSSSMYQGASPVYVEMVSDVQNDINGIQIKSKYFLR